MIKKVDVLKDYLTFDNWWSRGGQVQKKQWRTFFLFTHESKITSKSKKTEVLKYLGPAGFIHPRNINFTNKNGFSKLHLIEGKHWVTYQTTHFIKTYVFPAPKLAADFIFTVNGRYAFLFWNPKKHDNSSDYCFSSISSSKKSKKVPNLL